MDRAAIYRDDNDRVGFGTAIADAHVKAPVEIHAYCLMGNHFHLLVNDPDGDISTFMHHLGTTYSRRFNDRHGRDGPLFRSRFHSVAVDSDAQLLRTLRYVHLNPVDVVGSHRLETFRWSSHRTYSGHRRAPDWLVVRHLLSHFDGVGGYRAFISRAVADDSVGPHDIEFATAVAAGDLDLVIGSRNGLIRDVGLVLIDRHPARTGEVGASVLTGTPSSRRSARSRARRRVRDSAEFASLVQRVERMLQLGPVPSCSGQAVRSSPARSWAA